MDERNMFAVRGTDGIEATVAEPLVLIEALDKESV